MKAKHILLFPVALFATSCLEQYNPRPYWEQYAQERDMAHRNLPQLTENGMLPEAPQEEALESEAVAMDPVTQKYATFCATCHGANGEAKGGMAEMLKPRPRDFTDLAWQDSVDDEHIEKVIRDGGESVGLSPTMAPWGSSFSADELKDMVKKIREFRK